MAFLKYPTENIKLLVKSPLNVSPKTEVSSHHRFISVKIQVSYNLPTDKKFGIRPHMDYVKNYTNTGEALFDEDRERCAIKVNAINPLPLGHKP